MQTNNRFRLVYTRSEFDRYIVLSFTALVAGMIVYLVPSVSLHILAMWLLAFVSCVICGFDFFHPYFWFSVFFTLYSTANAVLLNAGVRSGNYTREQILYPIIALTIVLFIVGPRRRKKLSFKFDEENEERSGDEVILEGVIILFAIVTIVASFILRARGYSSKVAMRRAGDYYFRYTVHIVRFMTLFTIILVGKVFDRHNRIPWMLVIFAGVASLIFTLFTSERDVIIRYGYTVVLLLFAKKVLKPKHIPIVAVSVIVAMVLSVIVKPFFLRGVLNYGSGNVIYDFLASDFNAAGRNLQYLMDTAWTKGALGWKTLFTEVFEPVLIGVRTVDPDYWFNYTVHTGGYKGYAFTLVGTGYAIGGLAGIVAVFLIVGIILKIFYNRYYRSAYWLAAYIYLSSAVIFSFRQSLQTITGTIIEHIGLGILFCILIRRVRVSNRNR